MVCVPRSYNCYQVSYTGFKEEHSKYLHKGFQCANIQLLRFLSDSFERLNFGLVRLDAGSSHSKLAGNATAIVAFDPVKYSYTQQLISKERTLLECNPEISKIECLDDIKLEFQPTSSHDTMLSVDETHKALKVLHHAHPDFHGVLERSPDTAQPVTSCNMGFVQFENGHLTTKHLYRSCSKEHLTTGPQSIISHYEAHPNWQAKSLASMDTWTGETGPLYETVAASYAQVMMRSGEKFTTHGGNEVTMLAVRLKNSVSEALSIGPTIIGAHTDNEKILHLSVPKIFLITTEATHVYRSTFVNYSVS